MVLIFRHLIKTQNISLIRLERNSAHNAYEIRTKELQFVNTIFLSSIFKQNKNYLGINRFKLISLLSDKPVIALGGISVKNLKKLKLLNCLGFAGISFFEQKKGP